jgi:hypothetical protein
MGEIGTGDSVYPVSLPTNNSPEFDKALANRTKPDAQLLNDVKDNIEGIGGELGLGVKGGFADLAARLDSLLVTSVITSFTAADTTPSIASGHLFSVPAAVTITNFDDPPATGTKLIEIIALADGVKLTHDATKIKLVGETDATLNTDDTIVLRYDGTKWVERQRTVL